MFLELDKKDQNKIAIIDSEGNQCSYGQILEFASQFYAVIHKRTLIFILNDNSAGAAIGYLGAVSSHVVPLMLGASMDKELMDRLIAIYQPEYMETSVYGRSAGIGSIQKISVYPCVCRFQRLSPV